MSLTRHKTLPNTWVARYYPNGRRKDPKTGKPSTKQARLLFEGSEADARAWYASLLRGKRPLKEAPIAPTLCQAWPDFCVFYENQLAKSTWRDYLCTWGRHLEPFFGRMRPGQINPGLIEAYKKKRLNDDRGVKTKTKTKPKTINKELSYLSAMCAWMAKPEINRALPLGFQIKGFPASKTQPPEPIIIDRSDMIRFLRAADRKTFRPLFAVFYYTGMRRTEVLTLTGPQINLKLDSITVTVKGGKIEVYPIHRKIRVYLRKRKRLGYIFTNPKTSAPWKDLKWAIKRAAKKAGVEQHIHPHLFRHTFGVHAILSGIGIRALQHLLGHSSSQVTERYSKLAAAQLNIEMNKFGGAALKQHDAKNKA
jgi:integrase